MASKTEVAELLKPVQAVYQHQVTDEEAQTYYELLRDYEACVIGQAITLHMMTSKFFPKPSELIEFILPLIDMGKYKLTKLDIAERNSL